MKKLLLGILVLTSLSAFAEELTGLNCSTTYVIHDVRRTPYENSRIVMRRNLLGGESDLGFISMNNQNKNFVEKFNLTDSSEAITYKLNVQKEITVLSMKLQTKANEVVLIESYQFKTKEGFSRRISLSELLHIGELSVTDVFLVCLPVYR
jgi:hypothetical protein